MSHVEIARRRRSSAKPREVTVERFDVWHEVPLVPQLTGMSCWAAAAAMIVGWRECIDVDPDEVARGAGAWEAYREGLLPEDVDTVARAFGLVIERPRTYSPAELRALLERYGPLWVGEASPGLHVIVVAGLYGDGSLGGTFVRIADPWPIGQGERYTLSFREFAANLAAAADVVGATAQVLRGDGTRGGSFRSYQRFSTKYRARLGHPGRRDTMATYVIDCGHGGNTAASRSTPRGVIGPTGLSEKEITLDIGSRLVGYLGRDAVLTRDEDKNLSLAERADTAHRLGAEVFISLHANEGEAGERGPETWVHPRSGQASRALARSIQHELARVSGEDRGTHEGEMAVLSPDRLSPSAAACLVEIDYLSDPHVEERLRDPAHLDAIAQAIARGATSARFAAAGQGDEGDLERYDGERGSGEGRYGGFTEPHGVAERYGHAERYGRPARPEARRFVSRALESPQWTSKASAIVGTNFASAPPGEGDSANLGTLLDAAVEYAMELWEQGISEARDIKKVDAIVKESGFAYKVESWDWCGMFVAACLYHVGLHKDLRRGFYHVLNVEHYFRYQAETRVKPWISTDSGWQDLETYHKARGSVRSWMSQADLKGLSEAEIKDLDIQPGDVALIDHEPDGKANHIVLVEAFEDGVLSTLEGNAGGTICTGVDADGNYTTKEASKEAVVRKDRDLKDKKVRAKLYGVGRLSIVDFEEHEYADKKPKDAAKK